MITRRAFLLSGPAVAIACLAPEPDLTEATRKAMRKAKYRMVLLGAQEMGKRRKAWLEGSWDVVPS